MTESSELIVQRRFPTYDFVVRTPLSQNEAAARLKTLVTPQPRPKGFTLFDSRIHGRFDGSSFRLYPGRAALQGHVTIQGDLLPRDGGGSDIPVRVALSRASVAFFLIFAGAILVGAVMQPGRWFLAGIPPLLTFSVGLILAEGHHASKIVESAFRG